MGLFPLPPLNGRGQPCSRNGGAALRGTCASEGVALGVGGGRRLVPLGHALQQVVQAPEAACQIAQEALLARAVLRWQAYAAHVGG